MTRDEMIDFLLSAGVDSAVLDDAIPDAALAEWVRSLQATRGEDVGQYADDRHRRNGRVGRYAESGLPSSIDGNNKKTDAFGEALDQVQKMLAEAGSGRRSFAESARLRRHAEELLGGTREKLAELDQTQRRNATPPANGWWRGAAV